MSGLLSRCHVSLFATPRTVVRQAPLSVGFSRQEDWSGLLCLPPGDLCHPGIEPASLMSPALGGGCSVTRKPSGRAFENPEIESEGKLPPGRWVKMLSLHQPPPCSCSLAPDTLTSWMVSNPRSFSLHGALELMVPSTWNAYPLTIPITDISFSLSLFFFFTPNRYCVFTT